MDEDFKNLIIPVFQTSLRLNTYFLDTQEAIETKVLKQNAVEESKYKILNKIAEGKFAIHRVRTVNNEIQVIKVFPKIEGRMNRFFINEVRCLKFDHPHLIKLHDYSSSDTVEQTDEKIEASLVFMEFAPYGTLYKFLNNYKVRMTDELCFGIFKQIVDGVKYIHSMEVAHLDLKLENILIGSDFRFNKYRPSVSQ